MSSGRSPVFFLLQAPTCLRPHPPPPFRPASWAFSKVFSSAFWIISFLPTLVTPLVAKAAALGDVEGVKKQVGEALFISVFIGMMGCILMTFNAHLALQIVGVAPGSETAVHAIPYIQ